MKPLPLAVLLALAGCDGAHPAAPDAHLEFVTERQDGAGAELAPRFEPGDGALTVTGSIVTPCLNQQVDGALRSTGGIVLTVTVLPSPSCLTAVGYVGYTARRQPAGGDVRRARALRPGPGRRAVAGRARASPRAIGESARRTCYGTRIRTVYRAGPMR